MPAALPSSSNRIGAPASAVSQRATPAGMRWSDVSKPDMPRKKAPDMAAFIAK